MKTVHFLLHLKLDTTLTCHYYAIISQFSFAASFLNKKDTVKVKFTRLTSKSIEGIVSILESMHQSAIEFGTSLGLVEDPPLLLTYSTHETAGLRLLENSVRGRGFEFRVLGLGDTWINFSENKIKSMRRELAKYQDDDERIVLFSDAKDVLFLGDARSVVDKFRQFHCKILVSAEILAWPLHMAPK